MVDIHTFAPVLMIIEASHWAIINKTGWALLLIPILIFIIMEKEKLLKVTAKYGSLEFYETAWPYDENAQVEQFETCHESIARQIDDAGKAEMADSFAIEEKIV